jgi:hypothetical protein
MKQSQPMDKLEMKLREQQHEEKDNHYRQTNSHGWKLNVIMAVLMLISFYLGILHVKHNGPNLLGYFGPDKSYNERREQTKELKKQVANLKRKNRQTVAKNKILLAEIKQFRSDMIVLEKQQKATK